MPEYLLVCCWRSAKEASLLLGQLTQSAPIVDDCDAPETSVPDGQAPNRKRGLLTVEKVNTSR